MFVVITYTGREKNLKPDFVSWRYMILVSKITAFPPNRQDLFSPPTLVLVKVRSVIMLIWQNEETRTQSLSNLTTNRKIVAVHAPGFWNIENTFPAIQTNKIPGQKMDALIQSLLRDANILLAIKNCLNILRFICTCPAFGFCTSSNTRPTFVVKITAPKVLLQVQAIKDGVAIIQETWKKVESKNWELNYYSWSWEHTLL